MLRISNFALVTTTLAFALGASLAVAADVDPPADPTTEPLRFQRILAPADRPEDWPRDKLQRYLPMPADKFERRVRQLGGEDQRDAKTPAARLVNAEYTVELVDDNLTGGTATWHFEHRGNEREIVLLENCRLAIDDAQWIDANEPALLGNDQHGRLAAVVEAPGKLRCRWSLRGQRNSTGQLRFDLALPPCPVSSFELTLPANLVPTVDRGLVSVVASAKSNADQRQWRIDLGGHSQFRLRIAPEQSPRNGQPSPLVRNHFVYEFSERGLELGAEFRIDAPADPLRQVTLLVDRPLTAIFAQLDEIELPAVIGASDGDGPQRVTLNFPEPLAGHDRTLQLKAVAPLKHGMPERLPQVRLENARWQQGTASLLVAPPLVLEDLTTRDCRRIDAELTSAALVREAIALQFFTDVPRVEFQLSPRRDRVEVVGGTSISLRANHTLGHLRAELTAASGERFALEADVAPQWIIDTVEATPLDPRRNTAPPAAPEDYVVPETSEPVELVEDWSFTAPRGRHGKLRIELKAPLTSQRGIALEVTGRRRRTPSRETLGMDDLRMLEFADTTAVHRIVHVHAAEGFQIQAAGGDNLHRLDSEQLSPADVALLDAAPTGLIFVDDEGSRNLSLSTIAQPPKFSADIRAEAHLHDDRLAESYQIAITPQGQEIDRLTVRFTQPREEDVQWKLADDATAQLDSRRLSGDEQTALGFVEGEAWEVKLPVPRSKPFVLLAQRDRPFRGDTPVALVSLVGAESQQGAVQIRSSAGGTGGFSAGATGKRSLPVLATPEIRTRRLKSIPVEPTKPENIPTVLAAFRFDPEESSLVSAEPPLVLAPRLEQPVTAEAWIWQAQLESRYHQQGAGHVLTCRVESAGRDQIRFQLPVGAELRGAWIDDRAALDPARSDPQRCQINLPIGARFVTVVLHWVDEPSRLGHLAKISAPWPDCTAPMLSRQWIVALPPGEQIADADLGSGSQAGAPWMQRLFGPLARRVSQNISPIASSAGQREINSVDAAVTADTSTNVPRLPWKADLKDRVSEVAGWTSYRFDCPSEHVAGVWIVNQRSSLAWFWAVLAIAGAIRWWIGRRRLSLEIGLLTVATAAALVVPAVWTTVSAAAWLGIIAAQLFIWCGPRLLAARSTAAVAERSSRRRNVAAAATTATLLIVALWQGLTWGQEATAKGGAAVPAEERSAGVAENEKQTDSLRALTLPARQSPLAHVLVPVDRAGQPSGDLYYLPESFHDELLRATASIEMSPPSYLILHGSYRAELHRDGAAKDLATGVWKAAYEIESLADRAVVELPLGFDGATLEPDGVRLDGQNAGFHWNEARHAVAVELPQAGRHRLEVLFRPQRNLVGYDFAVPVVAGAELALTTRDDIAAVVTSAIGSKRPSDQQQISVALGPSPRIVLQETAAAQQAATSEPAAATFECEQLCWLRVRPGAVVVDARFKLRVPRGRLSQLRLAVDPRLRFLSSAETAASPKYRAAESEPGLVIVDWSEPVVGQTALDLSFVIVETTGIGHFYLPSLDPRGGRTMRRLWAVSIDPSLEFIEHPAEGATKLAVEEFIAAWGAAPAKPQLALSQSHDVSAGWHIAARPEAPNTTARYQLAAVAGSRSVEVRWLASVEADGPVFQYRLKVPENLEIDEVSTGDGVERHAVRWTRCRPTTVAAFLDVPATGQRKLFLRGRMPLPRSGQFALPEVRLEACQRETFDALILRRPESLVEIADLAGATIVGADDSTTVLAQARRQGGVIAAAALAAARVVAVLTGGEQHHPVAMKVQRNAPRATATQLTSLVRQADRWRATVDLELRIRSGLVDELRFDLPAAWTGPFEITPSIPSSLEESAGAGQKQLVIRPESPLAETLRLRIAAPLALAAGQRPAAPQVRLNGSSNQTHYFLLPRRYEQQQLSWDTSGLIDKPLPEGWLPEELDAANYRALQQVAERYRAELRSVERGAGNPQIRLADFSVARQLGGSATGVAAFDLEPAGATSCPLELPTAAQLLRVRLDGSPAQLLPQGENRWNVWLGDNNLPRRLEVIYRQAATDDSANSATLNAPVLVGIPVERTLWTIFSPIDAGPAMPRSGSPITKLRHHLFQFECTANLIESADNLLQEEPVENVARWYLPWAERLRLSRTMAEQERRLEMEEPTAHDDTDRISAVESEQTRLARRLGVSEVFTRVWASRSNIAEPADLLSSTQQVDRAISHVMLAGSEPALEVDFPRRIANARWRQFFAAIATLLVGGVLVVVTGRRNLRIDDVPYLPEAVGALAGLAWWIWLTPAIVGPAIIAVSALAAWRSRSSPRQRTAARGSTITRAAVESQSSRVGNRPR